MAVVTGFSGPEAVRYDPDQDVYFVANFNGDGGERVTRHLDLGDPLPAGYHALTVEGLGPSPMHATIIASPMRSFTLKSGL